MGTASRSGVIADLLLRGAELVVCCRESRPVVMGCARAATNWGRRLPPLVTGCAGGVSRSGSGGSFVAASTRAAKTEDGDGNGKGANKSVVKMARKRTTWNDNTTKRLVDICIDEKENGCSKFDWAKTAKNLSVQTQMNFVLRQVSNHYHDLKDKYKDWLDLRSIMNGIGFDPKTGAVRPEEAHLERWKSFEEKYRKYAHKLAKKGLPNVDDLERLFAGRTAHGERGFSTAMARTIMVNDLFGEGEGEKVGAEDEVDPNISSDGDVSGEKNSTHLGPPTGSKKKDKYFTSLYDTGLEELKRLLRPSIESTSTRRPLRIGGESGAENIHRLTPDLFKEKLRLHRGASYRDAADVFEHSISTISKYFKKVLDALVTLSYDIVRPHADLSMVPPEIMNNSSYWPFFEDYIGALDGTHIQAIISDNEGIPFRGRKGTKTWNILACCSFDRIFTFINVGWEGSVHDITVWVDSLTQSKYGFSHPPTGKYYLVDSGYPNITGYLSPIMDPNVRYHIPDFKKKRVLRGMSEQFNYRHSSLRTTVARAFDNLKKRWKILHTMPQIKVTYQVYVIVATFTLHNFIRMCKLGIPISEHDVNVQARVDSDLLNPARKEATNKVRKEITLRIWRSIPGNIELEADALQQEENIEPEDHMQQEDTSNMGTYMEEQKPIFQYL
ncbi:hypothetical protein OROMI_001115 [Orobanche minor]